MKSVCNNIQEQIPELIAGTLSAEKTAETKDHIERCPACCEYFNALQADDKLLTDFAEAMQPSVARLEEGVVGALSDERASELVGSTSIWRTILRGPAMRFAAAAVLLIGVGYMVGRVSAPRSLDMGELQSALETSLMSSLKPAIRQDLLGEVDRRMQSAYVANSVRLKDELHEQVRRDLTQFAAETLAASTTITNRRVLELVQLIEAARTQDRQRMVKALEQIELNRLRDRTELGDGLVALAVQTDELLRVRQDPLLDERSRQ
ncbi:MAG: zf-HC2 domain-containing protein [Phycisphaerales bacterium]|nr:MAG: zf-HC2 domain-containing protein [Phycisphaerales bacterium]